MKKNILFFIILVIILLLSSTSFTQEIIEDSAILNSLYSEFKYIEYFNFIYVHTFGSAEEIGLNGDYLTKYAKLRFKNNFAYIDYIEEDISDNCVLLPEEEQKK